jgi:hypothetical protein
MRTRTVCGQTTLAGRGIGPWEGIGQWEGLQPRCFRARLVGSSPSHSASAPLFSSNASGLKPLPQCLIQVSLQAGYMTQSGVPIAHSQ